MERAPLKKSLGDGFQGCSLNLAVVSVRASSYSDHIFLSKFVRFLPYEMRNVS
jgi:hypothetical protein